MLKHDTLLDRLVDAELLWNNDRKNGAFIQTLIALAGLSSLRYPKKTVPRVYFDKMREYHPNQKSQIDVSEKNQKSSQLSDKQRFKCMVLDLLVDIIMPHPKPRVHPPKYNFSLPFSEGKTTNIENLFYEVLRCTAVHQGTFASVAYLTERTAEGDVLRLTQPAGIPEWWIIHLIAAIRKTPELA